MTGRAAIFGSSPNSHVADAVWRRVGLEGSEVRDSPVSLLDESIAAASGAVGEMDGQAPTDLVLGDAGANLGLANAGCKGELAEAEHCEEEHGDCRGVILCRGAVLSMELMYLR